MATTASQVILHPYVSNALKVGNTTVGRDKLYRAVQYLARFLAWYTFRKGYSKETVSQFEAAKSHLGLSRKLLRIGKPLEHLQASLRALSIQDPVLKLTTTGRQICYCLFLYHDMYLYLHTSKIYPLLPATYQKHFQRSAKLWFYGIFLSILNSTYKLYLLKGSAKGKEKEGAKDVERKKVQYQLVQDCLDILIPTNMLKWNNLDEGVLGLVGLTTSLMGLKTQVENVVGK
ncbi:peroxisomal biogenesis factor 11 [Atractiella rhizophila]|nr:peroxisomal biogenesis factor 11 [Atractiella rhizophila]